MREALAISSEEGLKEQWERHENMHHLLWDGLKSMGLKSFVQNDDERLITVNTITVSLAVSPVQCGYVSTITGCLDLYQKATYGYVVMTACLSAVWNEIRPDCSIMCNALWSMLHLGLCVHCI